jgi:hypothetical protein
MKVVNQVIVIIMVMENMAFGSKLIRKQLPQICRIEWLFVTVDSVVEVMSAIIQLFTE